MVQNIRSSCENSLPFEALNATAIPILKQTSTVDTATARFEWRIENFALLWHFTVKGYRFSSKSFACPHSRFVSWKMEIYPNGYADQDEDHIYFGLTKENTFLGKISDVLFAKDEKANDELLETNYQIYIPNGKKGILNVTHFATREEEVLLALDSDGSLQLTCQVESLVPAKTLHTNMQANSFKRLFSGI